MVKRRGRLPLPRASRLVFWDGVRAGLAAAEAGGCGGCVGAGETWFRAARGVKGNGPPGSRVAGYLSLGGAGGDHGRAGGGLRGQVQCWLEERWSPEQISVMLRAQIPDDPEMWVSYETIYQSVYVQGRAALQRELVVCLRMDRILNIGSHQ